MRSATTLLISLGAIGVTTGVGLAGPLSFSDEAATRGVNFHIDVNYSQYGSGSMFVDIDNDGDLDIVIAGGVNNAIGVFENDGTGNFTDRSLSSGMTAMEAAGMAGADYDNDGDIDIYIGGWLEPSRLYRNNGDFTFTDVAPSAGVNVSCPSMSAAWSDIDADGDLDLYSSVRTLHNGITIRNFMFINNGDGTFTDEAGPMGIDAELDPTLVSSFWDYDRDGDDDLYLGTDKGSGGVLSNRLYRNDGGGVFTEITNVANAEAYVDCMGIAVGDLDFDGLFDMYVTNTPPGNKLLMNNGSGVFVDETVAAGVGSYRVGWGTVFADFDNDTELDLYVCNMMGENRLYRGSQTWPLVDEGPTAGVDEMSDTFCAAVGDVDGDNDLDMLVGGTDIPVRLYINNSADAASNNWVRFNVVGNDANQYAIGTCVDISAGGKNQVREVRAGVNYKVNDEFTLHYGLGSSTSVDSISVVFNGNSEIRNLTNAPANQTWTIYPTARLGDPNGNGRVDYFELFQALASRTPPGQSIVPGQEIFDMDGDFDIDNDDLALMGLAIRTPSVKGFGVGP